MSILNFRNRILNMYCNIKNIYEYIINKIKGMEAKPYLLFLMYNKKKYRGDLL